MNALSTYVAPAVATEPPATSATAPITGALTLLGVLLLGAAIFGGSDKKAKDKPRVRHLRGPATW